MSDKSPLFSSAFELYAHAVELYASKRPHLLKFAILHLANSVELLLKDALLDLEESIYRNPKETVSVWTAFDMLERHGVRVPGKQHIELLIDDRNAIQHRFGFPDERTTFYYLDEVGKFLDQFLTDRYGLKFKDVVSDYIEAEQLPIIGLAATPKDRVSAMFDLSPSTAVLEAYKDLEYRLMSISEAMEEELPYVVARFQVPKIITELARTQYLPADALEKFSLFRRIRNAAAHGRSEQDWKQALDLYSELVQGLERAVQEGFTYRRPEGRPESAVDIGSSFASAWLDGQPADQIRELSGQAPKIPSELDRQLLQYASEMLMTRKLDEDTRGFLREGFWKTIRGAALRELESSSGIGSTSERQST